MKRETLRHPKTLDLTSRLGVERPTVLGYLQLLWDFTAEHATRGDVGKWPDGAIAGACDWKGDASEFIVALIDSGFLDRDETHRLIVHDWSDHCERWVKLKLSKLRQDIICTSTGASIERSVERPTEPSPPRDQSNPILTNPIQSKPNLSAHDDEPDWMVVESEFIARWNALEGIAKHSTNDLPSNLVLPFRERWRQPGWLERAMAAMGKFPLRNGVTMSLRKFLADTTIDEILGGVHDFDRKGGGSNKSRNGPGQSFDPNTVGQKPTVGGF